MTQTDFQYEMIEDSGKSTLENNRIANVKNVFLACVILACELSIKLNPNLINTCLVNMALKFRMIPRYKNEEVMLCF